jgi:hypothetical protein
VLLRLVGLGRFALQDAGYGRGADPRWLPWTSALAEAVDALARDHALGVIHAKGR